MMQGGNNLLGMVPDQNELMMAHTSADARRFNNTPAFITKQENDPVLEAIPYRRSKSRSAANSNRSDGNKFDEKIVILHGQVQNMFASLLSNLLNDSAANELQCCMTYGKPCGCIRKYILAGSLWKEQPSLRISSMKDKDQDMITASDRAALHEAELARARELLGILHHAAELKKEKCYTTTEGANGKPTKELRGMIGLGNGRKRSKKYEDFVLDRREVLREKYSLCEKAAQKLLGYSINFLYKKLRTNPQKTSRLVATNKAERAAKSPRHLISLQQLQEMASNQQSSQNQCCCRNCINWLVKQHFDKIVDWRRRLEGSGQRVAQQIVAEVLLASASLDGQNSFCQNLVHWVTGCSFKKIRRVRDHLKKDPKSLPEHGLKKYWKEKGRNKSKARGDDNFMKPMKSEKDSYLDSQGRFPMQYDARNTINNDLNNLNNSNNRYDNDVQFIPTSSSTPPPNRVLPSGLGGMFPNNMAGIRSFNAFQQQLQSQMPNQQLYLTQNGNPGNMGLISGSDLSNIASNYSQQHSDAVNTQLQPAANFQSDNTSYNQTPDHRYKDNLMLNQSGHQAASSAPERSSHEQNAARPSYHEPHSLHSNIAPKQEPDKFYPSPFVTNIAEASTNFDGHQPYFFAPNPVTSQQDGFVHTGMTPLFLTQAAQQGDQSNLEQDGFPQFAGQQFFILSPAAIPNASGKSGEEFDSFKPMMMPLTPIHMYPASYIQGGGQNDNRDGPQHFVFSATDPNMVYNTQAEQDANYDQSQVPVNDSKKSQPFQAGQQQAYFPAALTPLAMMPSQSNAFFSGWFAAAQPPLNTQHSVASSGNNDDENASQHYAAISNANQTKYVEGSAVESQAAFISKQNQFYKTEVPESQTLPSVNQWAQANQNQNFAAVPQLANQWISPQTTSKDTSVTHASTSIQNLPPNVNISKNLESQMTSLSSVDKMPAAKFKEVTNQSLPEVHTFSAALKDGKAPESTEPKAASVSNRLKRFSRDRLVASVDSPSIFLPPMTPLTPSLTPNMLAGINAAGSSEALNVKPDESSANETAPENSVFRFPPSHVSRRMAALRVEGVPMDQAEATQAASASSSDDKEETTSESNIREVLKPPTTSSQLSSNSSNSSEPITNSATLGFSGQSPQASNIKHVPTLSIPSSCWGPESSDKLSTSRVDQLNTPTPSSQSSPSHLTTPTPQLHTPNQSLNTPNQPLNTPTQPLNTPTDVISPAPSNYLETSDEKISPVKPLMPPPAGKKRKTEDEDEDSDQKRPRFVPQFDERENDSDETKTSSKESATSSPMISKSLSLPDGDSSSSIKQPSVKVIPPVFSLPSSETTNPGQINTPLFVPSSAILRRASAADRSSSSTPPFFTFVPGSGFSTPMFLTPIDQFDSKSKQLKGKSSEGNSSDNQGGKPMNTPMKRIPSSLSLGGKHLADGGLQTPSKIPVVTPSLVLSAGMSDAQQVFCFPQVIPHIYKNPGTPDKNKPKQEDADSNNVSTSKPTEDKGTASSTDLNRLRPPSLVVDPPSDNEEESGKRKSSPLSVSPGKMDKQPLPSKSPITNKPTLHRTRSGSKKDLVLSLHNLGSTDSEPVGGAVTHSPLNTPLGLQVITPTLSVSKLTSPVQRFPPSMRVRPQPLMMAPVCLTPGGNTNQVTTPTIFQIISPSQAAPQSPSVMLYPYIRGSGPLSTGSIASPAFGFFQKAPVPSGSNSASLLKSALIKKFPVFQFPPPVPASTTETSTPEKELDSSNRESKSAAQSETPSSPRDSPPIDKPIAKPASDEPAKVNQ